MAVKKNGKLDEDRETYNGREASPVLPLALAPRIVHRNIGKTKYSFLEIQCVPVLSVKYRLFLGPTEYLSKSWQCEPRR